MRKMIIYLTEDKKNFHVVQPSSKFNQDWNGLAFAITGGKYFSFEII